MRMSLSSTSSRTFLIWALMVGVEQAPRAGGPPGMSQGMPERLVQEGPYRCTRNPMYGGHLLFLTGLAIASRSPLVAGYSAGT
jgi:protein-S-isoprenylcysteine O-methyltransferase Ste14